MIWTKEKTAAILRKLRDITYELELLDSGIFQLANRIRDLDQVERVTTRMRSELNYLSAMNNNTGNSALNLFYHIRQTLRSPEMDSCSWLKDLIQSEFLPTLTNSIRVLEEHRTSQQSFVDQINQRGRLTLSPSNQEVLDSATTTTYSGSDDFHQSHENDQEKGLFLRILRKCCPCC